MEGLNHSGQPQADIQFIIVAEKQQILDFDKIHRFMNCA